MKSSWLFFLFLFSQFLSAQNAEISRDSLLKIARIIIDSSNCHTLITVDKEGKPHAREMDPFKPDDDMIIWFGTSTGSRKISQINENPKVGIYYYDVEGMNYVFVSGRADIINDPELKVKYWKDNWKPFYPDREKDFILIKVTPFLLEVFSIEYHIIGKKGFMPMPVEFK